LIYDSDVVDTNTLATHSTRTTSANAKGLSLMEVARTTSWKNFTTFVEYYDKLMKSKFDDAI